MFANNLALGYFIYKGHNQSLIINMNQRSPFKIVTREEIDVAYRALVYFPPDDLPPQYRTLLEKLEIMREVDRDFQLFEALDSK